MSCEPPEEVLLSYIIKQIIPNFPNCIEDNCLIKAKNVFHFHYIKFYL